MGYRLPGRVRVSTLLLILSACTFVSCDLNSKKPPRAEAKKESARTRIGLVKFTVAQGLKPGLGNFAYTGVVKHLLDSGRFAVVDAGEIDRLTGPAEKPRSARDEEELRRQAFRQLRLGKLCEGSIVEIGQKLYVSVKVLNADMTVERVVQDSAPDEAGLEECVNRVAGMLLAEPDEAALPAPAKHETAAAEETRPAAATPEAPKPEPKPEPLKDLSGRWRISVKPYNYNDGWWVHRDFYIIPTDVVVSVQQLGDSVQFDVETLNDLAGNNIANSLKGTFRDGTLQLESTKPGALGTVQMTASAGEDGKTMRGSVKYWQMTAEVTLVRGDSSGAFGPSPGSSAKSFGPSADTPSPQPQPTAPSKPSAQPKPTTDSPRPFGPP